MTMTARAHAAPSDDSRLSGGRGVRMRLVALVTVMATVLAMFAMTPPAEATPLDIAPDAPTGVTGVGFDRSAVVWFTAPVSNGGSAVTGYTVTAVDGTTPANGAQTCATTDPLAGCTIAGLTNADSYTFTVTATNAVGTGASSTASATIIPTVVTAGQITAMSVGSYACVRLSNGTAECWGTNVSGQLGNNTTTGSSTPVRVKGVGGVALLTGVASISAGSGSTCAVLTDGGVDCWGSNSNGRLGNNSLTDSKTPVQVFAVGSTSNESLLTGVSSISAGSSHTCAVLTTGYVDCWGLNTSGQLGINSLTDSKTPVQVFAVGSISSGTLLADVASISAGTVHVCAVLTTGYVDCWGADSKGQLGNNSTTDSKTPVQVFAVGSISSSTLLAGVASISAGNNATCALLTTGNVDCWGINASGQLGVNTLTNSSTPLQVFDVGSASTDRVLSGVASVTAGAGFACALLTAGNVDCWGSNSYMQLGDNTSTNSSTPVAVIAAPPTVPTVSSVASHAATVSWTASWSALTYMATATDTTTPANGGQTCTTGSRPCTVSGLTNGDTYTFAVTAYNGFLTSAVSASTGGSVIAGTPSAPTSLVATPGDGSASIAFTAGSSGGAVISNYTYQLDGGSWVALSPVDTTTPVTITGLTNGTAYNVKLKAVNVAGDGTESAAVSVTPRTTPSAPISLVATPGNSTVSVAFSAGASNGSTISNYEYQLNGSGSWFAFDPAVTSSPVSIAVTNGVAYTVKLRAVNAAGSGAESVASSSFTPRTTPSAPTSLVATPGNGSASIAFVAGSSGGAEISNYRFQLDGGSWVALSPADAITPVTITGLTNGVTYSVKLRAVNVAGDGVVSGPVSVTPRTVPAAPSAVAATAGDGSVSIAFVAGATGGASISKYQYRAGTGSGAGAWADAVGTTSPIRISAANYSTYSIQLRAVNVAGGGAPSVAVSARPKLAGPTITLAYSYGNHGVLVGFAFGRLTDAVLVGFTVRAYAKGTTTVVSSCQVSVSARGCAVGSLVSGTLYDFRAQAYFTVKGDSKVRETFESAAVRVKVNS